MNIPGFGPLGELLLRASPVALLLVEDVLSRPTPDERDRVVAIGSIDDLWRQLGIESPRRPGDLHAVVTRPREEVVAAILASGLKGTLSQLTDPAPAGNVHLVVVADGVVSAGPMTPGMLGILAAAASPPRVTNLTIRHAMDSRGDQPRRGGRRRN